MTASSPSRELIELRNEVRHAFAGAARTFDDRAIVARVAGDELLERLAVVRRAPLQILDIGAGTGRMTRDLTNRYPNADVIALDLSADMLAQWPARKFSVSHLFKRRPRVPTRVIADAANLPFDDASMDFVVSNLALPCCDPQSFMVEVARVLTPGGVVMFTTVGPDTLTELAQAWEVTGQNARLTPFPDMHDLGDIMLKAGLADPVVDMEMLTLTHRHLTDLWADLRAAGSRCLRLDRTRTLTGRGTFERLKNALEEGRDEAGLLRTSIELIHGHAFAPESPVAEPDASGGSSEKTALKVHFQPQKQTD